MPALKSLSLNVIVLVALSYFSFGALGLSLAISPGYASPIFPAAGLAVALMLWSGNRVWPGIWLGSFVLNVIVSLIYGQFNPGNVAVAAIIACGASLQAFLAAKLVVYAVGSSWKNMELELDIMRCLVMAGAVASLVSSTTGVSTLYFSGVISAGNFFNSWWNWWVGDTLGVLIAMPMVLSYLYRNSPSWRNRLNTVLLPMAIVLMAVWGVMYLVNRWEQNIHKDEIRKHGESFERQLEQRYIAHQEAVAALSRLIEVTPDMSYQQFSYFTAITLKDNSDIFALSFNPYINEQERTTFEKKMSAIGHVPEFKIKERDAERIVDAGKRSFYVPVAFIAPLKDNVSAVGFDISSDPVRRKAIEHAISSGRHAVTAPVRLMQERQNRLGALLLHPAYQNPNNGSEIIPTSKIMGFAVAVVKFDELINIATRAYMVKGLIYEIDDVTETKSPQPVYRSDKAELTAFNEDYLWKSYLNVADRQWEIRVFASNEYLSHQSIPIVWILSVVSLFFTALLQVLMLVITGRTNLVESKVREQTLELQGNRDALQNINAQLNAVLKLSPDGFVAISPSGIIQFCNPAFQEITGISSEEVLYQHEAVLDDAFKKRISDKSSFQGIAACFVEGGTALEPYVLTLQHPRKVVVQLLGMHSDGSDVAKILYLRDITSESEIADIKTEFISHAAHELRTPMTSIYGYIELLLLRNFDEARRKEMLQAMQRQSGLMVNMINDLLDLARIDARGSKAFNFVATDIHALVSKIVSDMRLEDNRWNIELAMSDEVLMVVIDPVKISQAIMNVLTNAKKYSKNDIKIKISSVFSEEHVGIAVTDEGIGMTPEQLSHVGERFWRADSSGATPGAGLGVAIVKEILEFHGGKVEIQSTQNVGTTVTLWLPIHHHHIPNITDIPAAVH